VVPLALALAAALPHAGVLVPGTSLGGLRIGATPTDVRLAWGTDFGACIGCPQTTWYYTLLPFKPQGAGVTFQNGRVASIFTLWSPANWRTSKGLRTGESAARITSVYGPLQIQNCGTYSAYVLRGGRITTTFYAYKDKVWGFGLNSPAAPVCR
jgi:hypothetical protein